MTNSDEQLEQRLNYKFRNPALLQRALTHSSAIPELRVAQDDRGIEEPPQDNERLEFLGDAGLDLLVSRDLLASRSRTASPRNSRRSVSCGGSSIRRSSCATRSSGIAELCVRARWSSAGFRNL